MIAKITTLLTLYSLADMLSRCNVRRAPSARYEMGLGRAPTARGAAAPRQQMGCPRAETGASGAPPRCGGRWAIRRALGR
jgi:hypothetical protein